MTDSALHTVTRNRDLADKLLGLTANVRPELAPRDADAIVAHIEINDHHGVGVLVNRLFGQCDNIVSIRSRNFYEGRQDFGAKHVCICHSAASRDLVFWNVLQALQGVTLQRVVCIPYFHDDVLNAIALKNIFGASLCTYIMDDQNLCTDGIPDDAMNELLTQSALRLAISPELCAGYEQKYGRTMWFMPPVVPSRFIPLALNATSDTALESRTGIIVGNIWGQRWIELLRQTVRHSGVTLRWYNNGEFRWLPCTEEDLATDGVIPQVGPGHSDEQLVEILRNEPFVVVPTGTLDGEDDRHFITRLSLPSRIPYIFATSHAPILVLGSHESAAARFVTRAGIGLVAPYERRAFQDAVEQITRPDVNRDLRRAAYQLSHRFTDLGASDWIWRSLAKGEAADDRYQTSYLVSEVGSV